jgi:hypothetical protein
MALLSGSPAIDAGDNTICADAGTVNNLDQRGTTRPQGFNCDIGAYELIVIPAVTVNQAAGQSDPTTASPIHFTAVFSEPINASTFTASDVTLGGTAGGTTAVVTQIAPNDGTAFDIAVSGMTGSGTVIASIPADTVKDPAGNDNTASTSTDHTVTFDITPPTVTVNQASGQSDPTSASPIHFTAVFSKPINISTFTASDVTLGGTAGATTAVVTQIAPNNGTAFDIAVSGMTGSGTITASIPANTVKDPAGNDNTASTSTDNTVTFGHELLTNGGFNIYSGTSKVPQAWSALNFSMTDGKNTAKANVEEGSAAVQIGSQSPSLTKNLFQAILFNGLQGDKFIFSFWVKGSAIPNTKSCVGQVLFYKNNPQTGPGTPYLLVGQDIVQCPTGTFGYVQKSLTFMAPAAYNRIVVQFNYSATSGMVWFDKASLLK